MRAAQRVTIRSDHGALHVVPIWQCLGEHAGKVGHVTAHVDASGVERLTIEVDVSQSELHHIALSLKQATMSMTVMVDG